MFNLLKRLSLFGLFKYYWYIIQQKGYNLDSIGAFVITSFIFVELRKKQVQERGYSLSDLKYITRGIDLLYDEFDPRPFVNNSEHYIKKLLELKKFKMAEKTNTTQFKSFD